ncbi:MAG: hypothetical protein AAF432_15850 [Planctomycetota bacterium]
MASSSDSADAGRRVFTPGRIIAFLAVVYILITGWHTTGIATEMWNAPDTGDRIHRIFSFKNSELEPIRDGFALTYKGWIGWFWASLQTAMAGAALIASFVPIPRVRRTGLLLLVGWGILWAGNSVYMTTVGDPVFFGRFAVLHVLGFIAICVLTIRRWGWGRHADAHDDLEAEGDDELETA